MTYRLGAIDPGGYDGGEPGGYAGDPGTMPWEGWEEQDWWELAADTIADWLGFGENEPCWGYSPNAAANPCPGTPDYYAVYRALQRCPEEDIQLISHRLRSAHAGQQHPGPRHREAMLRRQGACIPQITKAILGGGDCVNSKYPDFPDWFRQLVATYGYPGDDVLDPGQGDPTTPPGDEPEPEPWTPTDPGQPTEPGAGPTVTRGRTMLGLLLAGGIGLLLVPKLLDGEG